MNRIEIEIKPMPAPRLTYQGRHTDKAKKYYAYKDEILLLCKTAGFELSEYHSITFYIPLPKSISKKEKQRRLDIGKHQLRPDLDNLTKAVWDALLAEDGHVHKLTAQKKWSEKGKIVIENL